MCGLAGVWAATHRPEKVDGVVQRMIGAIVHRGPDDSGIWTDEQHGIGLGHRRLAIQDLSAAGHQPMVSASGRYWLILNGEIYNHMTLREEMRAGGDQAWRGHSDTETLLALFERCGIADSLRRCVGMFAIAVWDRELARLTLARDRIGEKPLYFGLLKGALYFASELKAIRAAAADACEVDRESLALYMRHNYVPAPRTIYRGLSKLEPGSIAEFRSFDSAPTLTRYWDARAIALNGMNHPFQGDDAAALDALQNVMTQAVKAQLISDVPLGAFLSGGIDSSLIVALMQSVGSARAKTFTIGFQEKQYDEAVFAREVARHLGTDHTELYVSPEDALATIPMLPAIYDEPFADSSQIPTFLVSRLARSKVTVSLSGDAGDELFGGYVRYKWTSRIWKHLRSVPRPARASVAKLALALTGIARHPSTPTRLLRLCERVDKVAEVLSSRSPHEIYYGLVSHWKDPSSIVVDGNEPLTKVTDESAWLGAGSLEQHMMFLDLISYLPDDILVKVDRASMRVALESRVPMLDHRVVEFAWSLPMSMKIRNGETKWLLRRLLEKYVPRAMFERPKTGFGIPIDFWLRGPLRDWVEHLLDERRLVQEGYFHPAPILRKWHEHRSGQRNWGYYLWDVLMFQSWLEQNRESPR